MADPLSSTVAKALAPAMVRASSGAARTLWGYYNDPDAFRIPAAAESRRFSRWLASVFASYGQTHADSVSGVEEFMASPEFHVFVRQIIAFRLGGRTVGYDGALGRVFRVAYRGAAGTGDDADGRSLFDICVQSVDLLVRLARDDVRLPSDDPSGPTLADDHETIAREMSSEVYLASIDEQLSRLVSVVDDHGAEEAAVMVRRYTLALRSNLLRIEPPSFDGSVSVPLDDLYVEPVIAREEPGGGVVALRELFLERRAVLLGDPGSGKSTTAARLCALALELGDPESGGAVPFLVNLRDYGIFTHGGRGGILDYLVHDMRSRYQVEATRATIEWLLYHSRAHVLFDGLDELLDVGERRYVRDALQSFAALYTNVPVLATSRKVGYYHAALDPSVFRVHALGDFTSDAVERYARKWFALDRRLNDERKAEIAEQFLAESREVLDLRSNPLMLALMCNIYRTESYIPRHRPDVYEKCSRMLFDRWDRHRGIHQPIDFELQIEPAIMYIAHLIYREGRLQSGVTEPHLIELTADYLAHRVYESPERARRAAREFTEFCRGRAWVLTEVGLSAADEPLYRFTHRTFLEFFAGAYLSRTIERLTDLVDYLVPLVGSGSWEVVAELALQIKSKRLEGGPDAVVRRLHEAIDAAATVTERQVLLAFLLRCSSFLLTSPEVTRINAHATVRWLCAGEVQVYGEHGTWTRWARNPADLVRAVARETRQFYVESLAEALVELVDSGEELAECAVAMLEDVQGALPVASPERAAVEVVLGGVEDRHPRRHLGWAWSAVDLLRDGRLAVGEVRQALGLGALARSFPRPFESGERTPLAVRALSCLVTSEADLPAGVCVAFLRELASDIRVQKPIHGPSLRDPHRTVRPRIGGGRVPARDDLVLSTAERVDVGLVLAAVVEYEASSSNLEIVNTLLGDDMGGLECFRAMLSFRYARSTEFPSREYFFDLGGDLEKWAFGRTNFVRWSTPS